MSGEIGRVTEYDADGETGPEVTGVMGGEAEGSEGDPVGMDHFGPSGDDSPPLPGDFVAAVPLDEDDEESAAVAYADETARVAKGGEKRIYARNSEGVVVSSAFLKGDGSVTITNDKATVDLTPTGAIKLSNSAASVEIAVDGSIKLDGPTVSLAAGTPLGQFLTVLHVALTAWTPVNPVETDAAALKALLAAFIALPPPS